MTPSDLAGLAADRPFRALVVASIRPLGGYMARVFDGGCTPLQRLLRPMEAVLYRLCGIDPANEQPWCSYAFGLLVFHLAGVTMLYLLQRLQTVLPLNPGQLAAVPPDLALNTAVSFATNSSWQSYAGGTTLSYFVQMAGIAVQSFLSASAGIAVAIALVCGFARRSSPTIGNVWVDLIRAPLYRLLPICCIATVFFAWQGVPQTLGPSAHATTLEGVPQLLALGPVASQEAVKLLSGDGGGFFNANSAHPFENPTAVTSLLEMLLIFLLGAALTNTFGRMVGDERQGWVLFSVMAVLFLFGACATYASEAARNPIYTHLQIDQSATALQAGGNMEGKEIRFGVSQSALFATVTTASSDGAVNAMLDSFMPM